VNLPVTDHNLPVTHHILPVTDHNLCVTDHNLPVTDHNLPVTDHNLPVTDHNFSSILLWQLNMTEKLSCNKQEGNEICIEYFLFNHPNIC
jgi:protein xylosyltransferase